MRPLLASLALITAAVLAPAPLGDAPPSSVVSNMHELASAVTDTIRARDALRQVGAALGRRR